MKKLTICFLIAMGISTLSMAQKMELTNAILQIKEGDKYPKSLPKAIDNLKKVAANPEMAKTTKYINARGNLYLALASCIVPEINAMGGDSALDVSAKCFEKVMELEEDLSEVKKEYYNEAAYSLYQKLPPLAYNYAVKDYQKENYTRAAQYFFKSAQFNRTAIPNSKAYKYDTNSHVNAIIAACKAGEPEILVGALFMGSKRKIVGLDMYQTSVQYLQTSPYVDAYKRVIDSARIKWPKDKDFVRSELNFYLGRGENDLVYDRTEKLLKLDPENGQLYYIRAVMLEEKAKVEKKRDKRQGFKDRAFADYNKATSLDSNLASAYYNAALYYVNGIKSTIDSVNEYANLPMAKYKAVEPKAKALKKRIDEAYIKAIPYFYKAWIHEPDNADALKALVLLYGNLNDEKNSMFYSSKMDDLEKKKAAEKK